MVLHIDKAEESHVHMNRRHIVLPGYSPNNTQPISYSWASNRSADSNKVVQYRPSWSMDDRNVDGCAPGIENLK